MSKTTPILEKMMERIDRHKEGETKIIELCDEEYRELMIWANGEDTLLANGNIGYDQKRKCFIFADFEVRREVA